MFRTCIFCHSDLGLNEVVEQFPVGRRLAFDGERGRLWVICGKCRQWNLSPLEERWEAIESCERLFRGSRLRVSTEQVGLARLGEGLELVRIGRPQRPEFAAWRYGDRFGQRRRANFIRAGLVAGGVGAVMTAGAAAGVGVGGFGWGIMQLAEVLIKGSPNKTIAQVKAEHGELVAVKRKVLPEILLVETPDDGAMLRIPVSKKRLVEVRGDEALRAAAKLMPHVNFYGGSKARVQEAVSLLEEDPDPSRFVRRAAKLARHAGSRSAKLTKLPEAARLALEMAAHEDTERRALEGELALLEEMWRQAEEVAAIADNLFLPSWVDDFIRRNRKVRVEQRTDSTD